MRKGFTLIELLIVVTIIAILAGAAIPYVAQYIDDARSARAKQDLTEIRNAIVRYELEHASLPAGVTSINFLVGPYLSKTLVDPWGRPYELSNTESQVWSYGPDGITNTGDELKLDFRPPMSITRVEFTDTNLDGNISTNDHLIFTCTRPVSSCGNGSGILFGTTALNLIVTNLTNTAGLTATPRKVKATINGVNVFGSVIDVSHNATTLRDASTLASPQNFAKADTLQLKSNNW